MSRIFALTVFFIFYSHLALAEITIENVLGVTSYDYEPGGNNVVIWAGATGDTSLCSDNSNSDGTCNNCNGDLVACNERSINPNGDLTITFRSSSISGVPLFTSSDKQRIIGRRGSTQTDQVINANNSATLSIPWSSICAEGRNRTEGLGSCQLDEEITFYIGIDSSVSGENGNGNLNDTADDTLQVNIQIRSDMESSSLGGISHFALYPGDEKIYLLINDDEEDEPDDEPPLKWENYNENFPSYRGIRFQEIRFYYVEGENCSATSNIENNSNYIATIIEDIGTDSDYLNLSRRYFTESSDRKNKKFENNTTYVFISALVDQAGNVGFFYNGECIERDHVITPSEVTGMLEPKCFIATAAYGKSHKMLKTFYQFRDQKLLPYAFGRIIHRLYYTYSPPLAAIIQDNLFLKYMARVILAPFWFYAFLALQIGHIFTLSLLVLLMSSLAYFLMRKRLKLS